MMRPSYPTSRLVEQPDTSGACRWVRTPDPWYGMESPSLTSRPLRRAYIIATDLIAGNVSACVACKNLFGFITTLKEENVEGNPGTD
ncbi:hypothetical protein M514_06525 [Trichuris suis]|uniref:Uncharacterized protein n=1 Tax=Trichuris suis TaxID=68888 RepID=A0A085M632_9BILA|nr:hypothetical protein M513_06525 [Trichuris suis]KFD63818.1 hypothetical protein M514_06525 [Trichuris suis]